jgi:hypothetical protein
MPNCTVPHLGLERSAAGRKNSLEPSWAHLCISSRASDGDRGVTLDMVLVYEKAAQRHMVQADTVPKTCCPPAKFVIELALGILPLGLQAQACASKENVTVDLLLGESPSSQDQ